jgi:hypothetical protein
MAIRYNTVNTDFEEREGKNLDGSSVELTPQQRSVLDLKPRISRERGRFRLRDPYEYRKYITTPDHLSVAMDFHVQYQYFEDCEYTKDTIRNPSYHPKKVDKGKIVDDGGEFTHTKVTYADPTTGSVYHQYNPYDYVRGKIFATPQEFIHEGIDISTSFTAPDMDCDLSHIGPKLWRAMSPLKPGVEFGVDVAEARDLGRLVKGKLDSVKSIVSSLSNPKGLADWLLAIQFGWKPLVSDIRKLIDIFFKIDKRVDFILRNGGIPLFRRLPARDPIVTDEDLFNYEGPEDQGWMIDAFPPSGFEEIENRFKCKLTCRTTVTESATGVFIYFLGDIPPTRADLKLRLLGLKVNESLLWEATRWSWLVDWFADLGSIIANIQSHLRDRLVSLYAYSQRHTVREYKWLASNGFYEVSVKRVFDTKRRERIDPFGLAPEVSLSDLQLGILVALGLTRA